MVPKLSELIRMDEEYGVVMAALEGFAELLREAGPAVFQHPGHLEAIINCVTDVMTNKVIDYFGSKPCKLTLVTI